MARSSYLLSGKLPNQQREPIHNPNNGRGQEEAEEGMRGRKARRRRLAGGSFTNLGHRESERGGAGVREGAHRQEASSGRRQKRWEKSPCCMRESQRRRPLLKGIPESTHSFLFLRPRRPDVKTELVTVPTSTLSGKASPRSRGPPWRRFFHEGWKVVCQPK